jgi:electron transport complex protein RnfB
MTDLAESVLAALPQTQCTRCGYPDCSGYAQAVAIGSADINQCPPGGAAGVIRLAALTGRPARQLNPDNGAESARTLVFIDEAWCIGCTLCIKACPVDAIVGANQRMHAVIESACTGCQLCLPVCPVDCIVVENASGNATGWAAWSQPAADQARARYAWHRERSQRDERKSPQGPKTRTPTLPAALAHETQQVASAVPDKKRAVIEAALARARAKREADPLQTGATKA